jgi:hypothetical protein
MIFSDLHPDPDPTLQLVSDPYSDLLIFIINLQEPNKKKTNFVLKHFSAYYFLKVPVHLHHFSKIKSQKEVTGSATLH